MKRILIIKFWALGDVLMATPLLSALKRQWPDCRITWLVDIENADILHGNPCLDEIIAFDAGSWRRDWRRARLVSYFQKSFALRRALRQRGFDIVINLNAEKWWAAWMLIAPARIGLFPGEANTLLARLYTVSLPRARSMHNTRRSLQAAQALQISPPYDERMTLAVDPDARRAALSFLDNSPGYDPAKPLIVLHPGTSQESKCWPASHYASLAARLALRFNVALTGSPKESALTRQIVSLMPPGASPLIDSAGHLTRLPQTIALVAQAQAVVTGDTSVLHIASALQVPLVGIYGSTRPGDNAPLFGPHVLLYDDAVPCAPCYRARCPLPRPDFMRCQHAVTPAQALQALDDLLSRSSIDTPTKASYEPSSP